MAPPVQSGICHIVISRYENFFFRFSPPNSRTHIYMSMSAQNTKKKKKKKTKKNELKLSKPSFRKYETQNEVESMLLPPPKAVDEWISGKTVQKMKSKSSASDMQSFVKMQGRKAVHWLRKALRASYLSPEIKRLCKELLGVRYFTENLTPMELFNELQDDCKTAALDIGNELHEYYVKNELDKSLGSLKLNHREDFKGNRRQDAKPVGLPLPPHTKDWPRFSQESVMIHMLRLISMAVDEEYQELVSDTLLHYGCAVKTAPIKRDARMRNKALSIDDHRFEPKPRPALNIDINRNCCTFDSKENLAKGAKALEKVFKGFVRVKNMFHFSTSRAKLNFHYRTLMLSVLFEPGITFGDLSKRPDVQKMWNAYV